MKLTLAAAAHVAVVAVVAVVVDAYRGDDVITMFWLHRLDHSLAVVSESV